MTRLAAPPDVCAALVCFSLALGAAPTQQPPPQQPPPPAAAAPAPAAPAQDYVFPSGAGLLFFHVKPDKTAQFESVTAKIGEVLEKSQDPIRKQQALGWHIYKSAETAKEDVIYLFVFDPAISGADYDPVRLLGEGAPTEVQALYDRLKEAVVRVERMGVTKIR